MYSYEVDIRIIDERKKIDEITTFVVLAKDEAQLAERLKAREVVNIGRRMKVNDDWENAHHLKFGV